MKNFMFLCIGLFFITISYVTINAYAIIPNKLSISATQATSSVNKRLDHIESRVDSVSDQVTETLASLSLTANSLQKTLDTTSKNIDPLSKELAQTVKLTNENLPDTFSKVHENMDSLNATLVSVNSSIARVNNSRQLNCQENTFCYPNLITDTMLSIRETSKDISLASNTINKTFPETNAEFTKTLKLISDDAIPNFNKNTNELILQSAGIAKNINTLTKPKWYDRAIGYGVNAAVIYSRIYNPAAVVTSVVQSVSTK